jgi:hypothetical protein
MGERKKKVKRERMEEEGDVTGKSKIMGEKQQQQILNT